MTVSKTVIAEIIITTCICWCTASVLCLPGLLSVKGQSSQEARGRPGGKVGHLACNVKVSLPNKCVDTFQNGKL